MDRQRITTATSWVGTCVRTISEVAPALDSTVHVLLY
jgi:hypothetical protein